MQVINKIRSEKNMSKLEWNPKLAEATKKYSESMEEEDFFSHTDPQGHELQYRVSQAGYNPQGVGEVILKGSRWHERTLKQ